MKLGRKIYKSKKFKKAGKVISSKSFLGAFLFAFALWIYVNLSNEYTTYIQLPLEVILPENRALESSLPTTVDIEVKGTGWNLINLTIFNTSALCRIDLSEELINQDEYRVSRTEILKSAQEDLASVSLNDVRESLTIKTGAIGYDTVEIVPRFTITPKKGFALIGKYEMWPKTVRIKGNSKISGMIDVWPTERVNIDNYHKSFTVNVPLSDSLKGIINLSQSYVTVRANIQQEATVSIPDIPLHIKGGNVNEEHIVQPTYLNVTLSGPIDIISALTRDDIKARIDYADIINDSTGILIPEITMPDDLTILNFSPSYVYHKRRIRVESEFDL